MINPETSFHTIDSATMYRYDRHTNISWNMSEYRTPKLEVNVDLQIKKRKWLSQKKGIKDGRYVIKRGFYMDYDLKVAKGIPSPFAHGSQKSWDVDKLKKSGSSIKVDPKLKKYTYLQRIQMQQKNRKKPGIGTYSIQKSLKDKEASYDQYKKRTLKPGQRTFFYQNTQTLSNNVPGAGNYSPHHASSPSKMNNSDYKFWVKKHKQENEKLRKRELSRPAPGTHSPMSSSFITFDQLAVLYSKPSKRNFFGKDAKFEYTRDKKKVIVEKRPDPSVHSVVLEWKGKGVSPKKPILSELVTKGHSQSVYH